MPELKPCPFCGSGNVSLLDGSLWYASCDDCNADGPMKETREEAIALWNRALRPEKDAVWKELGVYQENGGGDGQ